MSATEAIVSREAYDLTVRIIERQQRTIDDAAAKLEDGNSLAALIILRGTPSSPST